MAQSQVRSQLVSALAVLRNLIRTMTHGLNDLLIKGAVNEELRRYHVASKEETTRRVVGTQSPPQCGGNIVMATNAIYR